MRLSFRCYHPSWELSQYVNADRLSGRNRSRSITCIYAIAICAHCKLYTSAHTHDYASSLLSCLTGLTETQVLDVYIGTGTFRARNPPMSHSIVVLECSTYTLRVRRYVKAQLDVYSILDIYIILLATAHKLNVFIAQ